MHLEKKLTAVRSTVKNLQALGRISAKTGENRFAALGRLLGAEEARLAEVAERDRPMAERRTARLAEGALIDPEVAEIWWGWADVLNPYGDDPPPPASMHALDACILRAGRLQTKV
jgi:hypothetical protein